MVEQALRLVKKRKWEKEREKTDKKDQDLRQFICGAAHARNLQCKCAFVRARSMRVYALPRWEDCVEFGGLWAMMMRREVDWTLQS